MSVLIKGMEMPKRCEDCFCYRHNAEYGCAYCNISSVNVLGNGSARLNNCPLVEVPSHGRLIDADALFEEVYKVWGTEYDASECNSLMSFINAAPTIIPEDKGNKNG